MAINALEVVSLELARLQCAVDEGDFDPLLQHYIETALDYCLNQINDPAINSVERVPRQVKQSMLLLVAEWFKNRESTIDGAALEIPNGVKTMLMQCRNWYGGELPEV